MLRSELELHKPRRSTRGHLKRFDSKAKATKIKSSARKLFAEGKKRLTTGSGAEDYKVAIELLKQASVLGHVETQA